MDFVGFTFNHFNRERLAESSLEKTRVHSDFCFRSKKETKRAPLFQLWWFEHTCINILISWWIKRKARV